MNPQDGCLAGNCQNLWGSFDANGVCPIVGVVSMVDSQENVKLLICSYSFRSISRK